MNTTHKQASALTTTAAGPAARRVRSATATPFTRGLGIATIAGMVWLAGFGLLVSPPDQIQKDSVRLMYMHVPTVYLAYLAFVVTAVASVGYLWPRTRSLTWDRIAGASAEIGIVFMAIALITGSIWGSISWGTYWVWDARLTSTAFLFVTYVGYLAVRRLGGSLAARGRRSAIVALLAVLEVPIVHYSVEWWRPLHQGQTVASKEIDGLMAFSLFIGIVTFTLLYVWLLLHRQRVLYLEDTAETTGLEAALEARRQEEA